MSYAKALYELSEEQGCTAEVYEAAVLLQQILQAEPSYLRLAAAPALALTQRLALLRELTHDMPPLLRQTILLLCENNGTACLEEVLKAYIDDYRVQNHIVEAVVTSAVELSANMQSDLMAVLQKCLGKEILLRSKVEPFSLGGLKLQIDRQQYDYSVAGQLEELGQLFKGANSASLNRNPSKAGDKN